MSKNLHPPFNYAAHTIFLANHGSHAYGTNLPDSDVDTKGIVVAPKEIVLGFAYEFEQFEIKPEDAPPGTKPEDVIDRVLFDVRKFCLLAAACNPNIIEVLFVRDADVLFMSEEGGMLREAREIFLSQAIRATFSGYAYSQLGRIETHRKWLLNPPKVQPDRKDYGLEKVKISPEMIGAYEATIEKTRESGGEIEVDPNVMELLAAEKRYRTDLKHWNQFLDWQKNRNEKRAALEAKYGYDTKHAMHLVRLMRMCLEICSGKGVLVYRDDAEELLAIRRGEWSYDHLMEQATKLQAEAKKVTAPLPKDPNYAKINDLCVQVQESFWRRSNG